VSVFGFVPGGTLSRLFVRLAGSLLYDGVAGNDALTARSVGPGPFDIFILVQLDAYDGRRLGATLRLWLRLWRIHRSLFAHWPITLIHVIASPTAVP
jgi:hypothetical protein